LPLEPVMSRFLGRHQRARKPVRKRSAAAQLNAERNGKVDGQAADTRGIAEQGMKRFEMVAKGLSRFLEPGKDSAVALVQKTLGCADVEPRDDLFSQLALALRRQARDDFVVIEDPRGDQRLVASLAICTKCAQVGQVGDRVDEATRAVRPPT